MYGRGRIPFRTSFHISTLKQLLGSGLKISISDRRFVGKQFSSSPIIRLTQLLQKSLALITVMRGVMITIMKYTPKPETRVRDGELNIVIQRYHFRSFKLKMVASVQHGPNRVLQAKTIALNFLSLIAYSMTDCGGVRISYGKVVLLRVSLSSEWTLTSRPNVRLFFRELWSSVDDIERFADLSGPIIVKAQRHATYLAVPCTEQPISWRFGMCKCQIRTEFVFFRI